MIKSLAILVFFILVQESFAMVRPWSSSIPANSQFVVNEELQERVEFWMKIYGHYTTRQGVFHLVDDPSFILGEVDTSLFSERTAEDKYLRKEREKIIQKWKIADPSRVRLQMGLKDRMQKAFFLSGKYLPMMEKIFQRQGLPIELTRLVFVESSFNILAQSKVGASGLWQIMPAVAKPHGYITKQYDKRNHPIYATKLAAKILKENFSELKSWPLAITAYNHGLGGVRRMISRTDGATDINALIESDSPTGSWGFASKNFYACFLAALEVERHADSIFGGDLFLSKKLEVREIKLAKSITKEKLLKVYDGNVLKLRQMNPHLNWSRIVKAKKVLAGVPLLIPPAKFHLVSMYQTKGLSKGYPDNARTSGSF